MINNGNNIQIIKIEVAEFLLREKKTKSQVESCKQTLSKFKSNNKDIEKHIELKENAKISLMKIQASIDNKLEEIKDLENAERNNEADPIFQPELYKIQKDIIKVSKEIEKFDKTKNIKNSDPLIQPELYKIQKDIINVTKALEKREKRKNNIQNDSNYGKRLSDTQKNIAKISKDIEKFEKEKQNIQKIHIIQPPVTTELPKNNKINRNVIPQIPEIIFFFKFTLCAMRHALCTLHHEPC